MEENNDNNTRTVTPQVRFLEFQDTSPWNVTQLKNISHRIIEKVGTKALTPVSITAGRGFVSQAGKFGRDISGAQYKNYIHLRRGDFAYNRGNSKLYLQGCVYRLEEFEEAAASTAFICFGLNDGYVPGFIKGLFEKNTHGHQLIKFITSGARSDGLLNINAEQFFSIRLPVPPTEAEQQKIADCLTSLDEVIAAQGRKVEALRAHKRGLMHQLFPSDGETQPRFRFPEFQNAGAWEKKHFSELCDIKHGYAFEGEFFTNQGEYVLLTPGNFYEEGGYRDRGEKQKYYNGEIPRDYVLDYGDLLVAMTEQAAGLLGSPILVTESDKFLHNQRLGLVTKKPGVAWANEFFFHVFNARTVRKAIHASASGAKVRHTSPAKIGEVVVAFPTSLLEQQCIAACISSIDDLIAAQSQKLVALRTHKKALMQQLFPSLEDGEA